ncbi:MAG: VOC family protein [Longimicrobiales bacterium]
MNETAIDTLGHGVGDTGLGSGPLPTRLPATTRLGPVRLQVAELGRSVAYYGTVLGFEAKTLGEGTVSLSPSGADAPLVVLHERPGARPAAPRGRLGLFHFAILLPTREDLGSFLRHLSQLGERPGASDHLVSEALYLRDPDGLGIEVYRDRPRSDWETRSGELRMETAPMDVQSVLEAGVGAPWMGMPSGTAMGHLHLHVGELGEAEAFYHAALGLDVTTRSYPGALFLSVGGYHHHLGLNTWAGAVPPAGESEARLLEWRLELPERDDLSAARARLETAGYAAEPAGDEALLTRDPWGTRLRLTLAGCATADG